MMITFSVRRGILSPVTLAVLFYGLHGSSLPAQSRQVLHVVFNGKGSYHSQIIQEPGRSQTPDTYDGTVEWHAVWDLITLGQGVAFSGPYSGYEPQGAGTWSSARPATPARMAAATARVA